MKKISIIFFSLICLVNSAMADFFTHLTTIEDKATGAITIVQSATASSYVLVFSLVLLAVGSLWIFATIKSR